MSRRTITGLATKLWNDAKRRADKKGMPFTLTKDWVTTKLEAGICELSGVPLEIAQSNTANSPSVDRKDNSKGYSNANCLSCCIYDRTTEAVCGQQFEAEATCVPQ